MKRILIIDDELPIRLALRSTFVGDKWLIWEADCARKAQELMAEREFDLVILDLNLPDVNGLQVLRTMREQEIRTPVVLISAYGGYSAEREFSELDCFGFLPKPFTPSEVRIAAARAMQEV
jgi:DNA-binding NtrC family response regulator